MRTANWPYDELTDTYTCPNNRPLFYTHDKNTQTKTGFSQQARIYECASCKGCLLAEKCRGKRAGSESPKTLRVNKELDRLKQKANDLLDSPCGRDIYARRKDDVESVFGDIKQNMGFRRFSLRGLSKVTHEFLLVSMGHNIRKLAKAVRESGASLMEGLGLEDMSPGLS